MAENSGDNNNNSDSSRSKYLNFPVGIFFKDARLVFKWDSLGKEILGMALPAALAVAADPIASLIDTAFIGHIGPVELAAAGVSIALFNQASRITIFPLVSITTSFVAEEDTVNNMKLKAAQVDHCAVDDDDNNKQQQLDGLEKGDGLQEKPHTHNATHTISTITTTTHSN